MESSSANASPQQQQIRDTRRVLQVLLPGLPPPAIDLACSTIFASTSLSQQQQGQQQQQNQRKNGRFRLRRVDSGQLGNISLVSPAGKQSKQFLGELNFDWDPASALAASEPQQASGRGGRRGH